LIYNYDIFPTFSHIQKAMGMSPLSPLNNPGSLLS
jgi:hypothetical protein